MSRGLVVIGVLVMLAGLGVAGYGAWTVWSQHQLITSARPVPATVLAHSTKDLKGGGFKSNVPLVKFEYTVDQQPYTAETVTPGELMLPPDWAETVFAQFPVGAQTQAYYDPNDPAQAFLIGKYAMYAYLPVLIGLVIAALGVGIIGDQRASAEAAADSLASPEELAAAERREHLWRGRMLAMMGVVGLVGGVPAIGHHLLVSTSPHERMGFLLEGAFAIAVVVVFVKAAGEYRKAREIAPPPA